jgi:hypothetical protein
LALERLTLDARSQPMQLLAPAAVDFTTGMSLDDGACDIFMSLLVIAPEMTLSFTMTQPVLNGVVGMVVEDWRRRGFRSWAGIGEQRELRIAVANERAQLLTFVDAWLANARSARIVDDLYRYIDARPDRCDPATALVHRAGCARVAGLTGRGGVRTHPSVARLRPDHSSKDGGIRLPRRRLRSCGGYWCSVLRLTRLWPIAPRRGL